MDGNHAKAVRMRDRVIVATLGYLLVYADFGEFFGGPFLVGFGFGGLVCGGGD